MPAMVLACWMGGLTGILAALGAAGPLLVVMGVAAGAGMAAGTLRAAARPATDWSRPPVETPFGPVPRDQLSTLLRGTDLTVLVMFPVMLALILDAASPMLVLAQLALSAGAIAFQARFAK